MTGHSKEYYKRLRKKYEPEDPKMVLVAESPPASGLYFYDEAGKPTEPLFAALMGQFLNRQFTSKADGLRAFSKAGFVLVDATYQAVNDRTDRDNVIKGEYPKLREDIRNLIGGHPVPILLIKANVCNIIEPLLLRDGFRVLNRGQKVYFPSTGHQHDFRMQVATILRDSEFGVASKG